MKKLLFIFFLSITFLSSKAQTSLDPAGLSPALHTMSESSTQESMAPELTATTSQVNVSCNGGANGSATVTPNGGTPPYSYNWSNHLMSQTASGLSEGTYTCTITDQNEISIIKTITITQPMFLTSSASQTNVSSNGNNDGAATISVSGGTPPYTYNWGKSGSFGKTAIASGLPAGTYSCSVFDFNGCSTGVTVTITEPEPSMAPVFTSTPVKTATAGTEYSYSITATDPLNKKLTFTTGAGFPDWLKLSNGNTVSYFGVPIIQPKSITTDTDGTIYVSGNSKIYKITSDRTMTEWFTHATGSVNGMAVYGGYLYMSYSYSSSITRIPLINPTTEEDVMTGLPWPEDIIIKDGFLYVALVNGGNVIKVNLSSLPKAYKSGEDNFITVAQPWGLAFDKNGNLFVVQESKISKYDITTKALTDVITTTDYFNKAIFDDAGNLYASFYQEGIRKYNAADFSSSSQIFSGNSVFGMLITATGKLVFGNYDHGKMAELKGGISLSGTPAIGNIGVHEVTVTADNGTESTDQTFSITVSGPATLSAFNGITKIYGDEAFELTAPASNNANGAFSYSSSNTGVATISGKKITLLKPGTTTITATQAASGYYTQASIPATLTVTPKDITVTFNNSDPSITKEYDGTDAASLAAGNYQLNGLVGDDNLTVTGTAVYDTKDAGTDKPITVSGLTLAGTEKDYYMLTAITGTTTGTITPRPVTVTADEGKTKVYGESDPLFTYAVNSDDLLSSDALTGALTREPGENVGNTYLVGLGTLTAGDNYAIAYTPADFSITAKPITITANSGQTNVYGDTDPNLTYTVVPALVSGDSFSGSLGRAPGKNVGEYAINIGSLTAGSNYNITGFTPATLTITPAPLVISAVDITREQGKPNPVFTFAYEGLANGDSPSDLTAGPEAQTTAGMTSPIGYYTIEAKGAASDNYTISYVPGKLTVMPAGNGHLKAWASSPAVLQIRIYAEVAQSSYITLYTATGQPVTTIQKQLQAGINSTTMAVGNLAPGVYILNVKADKFKEAQRVKIK